VHFREESLDGEGWLPLGDFSRVGGRGRAVAELRRGRRQKRMVVVIGERGDRVGIEARGILRAAEMAPKLSG
jgi:hypothetical protein